MQEDNEKCSKCGHTSYAIPNFPIPEQPSIPPGYISRTDSDGMEYYTTEREIMTDRIANFFLYSIFTVFIVGYGIAIFLSN